MIAHHGHADHLAYAAAAHMRPMTTDTFTFEVTASRLERLIVLVTHAGPVQRLRHYRGYNVGSWVTARTQQRRRRDAKRRSVLESVSADGTELLLAEMAFEFFDPMSMIPFEGQTLMEGSKVAVRVRSRCALAYDVNVTLVVRKAPPPGGHEP